jgi:hypothetical protein
LKRRRARVHITTHHLVMFTAGKWLRPGRRTGSAQHARGGILIMLGRVGTIAGCRALGVEQEWLLEVDSLARSGIKFGPQR